MTYLLTVKWFMDLKRAAKVLGAANFGYSDKLHKKYCHHWSKDGTFLGLKISGLVGHG